ncbi:hypothetical protein ACFV7Q_00290 [Streptomyces sp. NPDC059851]|uniref:hypothetical protein n=1 Tax=Streptomyces sp. NPDC059851 TaxID=3346971 RepID=UPI0036645B4B
MRKSTRIKAAVFAGIAALATATAVTGSANAAVEGGSGCLTLPGSWRVVDDNTKETFLGSYHGSASAASGTVNFSSPNNTTTASHGEWKLTGCGTYSDTDTALLIGTDGKANSTITFKANITVTGRTTANFDFAYQIHQLDGTLVTGGSSTGKGYRINVQPR